ncbi:PREDICTED: uncharacterized protein LOC104816300 [Tarenaya hassleriana]|uniref:uncharacterized protein LOC104816300 n=1 Tax=Tarenaya hassleriana TaxID=28532 RepID=UPI00053C3CEB|nr:PREDICTED: uncharacterized protein LOC104816300 [Tarenaya hassleriana]
MRSRRYPISGCWIRSPVFHLFGDCTNAGSVFLPPEGSAVNGFFSYSRTGSWFAQGVLHEIPQNDLIDDIDSFLSCCDCYPSFIKFSTREAYKKGCYLFGFLPFVSQLKLISLDDHVVIYLLK